MGGDQAGFSLIRQQYAAKRVNNDAMLDSRLLVSHSYR